MSATMVYWATCTFFSVLFHIFAYFGIRPQHCQLLSPTEDYSSVSAVGVALQGIVTTQSAGGISPPGLYLHHQPFGNC